MRVTKRPAWSIIGLQQSINLQGEPFRVSDTNTTARFNLSISVLIFFHLSAGAAFSHLDLVIDDTVADAGGSEAQNSDLPDATQSRLLDSVAHGQSRLLGRFGIAR